MSAPTVIDADDDNAVAETGAVAAEAAQSAIGKKQILKPVQIAKAGHPLFRDSLKGANQTLSELGLKHGEYVSVQDDIFAGEMADEDLPSPSDTLSTNDAYIATSSSFRDAVHLRGGLVLQMVPTSSSNRSSTLLLEPELVG